jgi:BlaI family transcriptional regulator, penicillinase repressor
MVRQTQDTELSRRERQIMDVVYKRGRATATEVRDALADAPSYSAVRALLRVLEEKGHLEHEDDGVRYIYSPTRDRKLASRAALRHVVTTFFEGSAVRAAAALLESNRSAIDEDERAVLQRIIQRAREEGK